MADRPTNPKQPTAAEALEELVAAIDTPLDQPSIAESGQRYRMAYNAAKAFLSSPQPAKLEKFVQVQLGEDGVWIHFKDGSGGGYSINLDAVGYPWAGVARKCANYYRALAASPSAAYAAKNPLGGPGAMFRVIAERLEAGEDYAAVLADYGLHSETGAQGCKEKNSEAPTPRVDEMKRHLRLASGALIEYVTVDDACQLERELADANADVLRLHREKMDALYGPDGFPRSATTAMLSDAKITEIAGEAYLAWVNSGDKNPRWALERAIRAALASTANSAALDGRTKP